MEVTSKYWHSAPAFGQGLLDPWDWDVSWRTWKDPLRMDDGGRWWSLGSLRWPSGVHPSASLRWFSGRPSSYSAVSEQGKWLLPTFQWRLNQDVATCCHLFYQSIWLPLLWFFFVCFFFLDLFFFLTLGCFCFWSMTLRLVAVTRIHSLSIDYRASIQTAAAVLLMLMVSIWWLVSFHSWCRDHQNQIWQWAGLVWCLPCDGFHSNWVFIQFFFFLWFVLVWFAVWFTTWSWRCTADFAFAFRLCLALKLVVHCPIWSFGFGSVWLSLAVKWVFNLPIWWLILAQFGPVWPWNWLCSVVPFWLSLA